MDVFSLVNISPVTEQRVSLKITFFDLKLYIKLVIVFLPACFIAEYLLGLEMHLG